MKDIVVFPVKAQATLGSLDDAPKRRVLVRVIGKTLLPGFYRCMSEHGAEMLVHRHKLEPEEKP